MFCSVMRLLSVVLVLGGLIAMQEGGAKGAAVPHLDSDQTPHSTGFSARFSRRTSEGDFLSEQSNPCFSLRHNEDQQQLLCNDRRSHFNINPFGLRFGKRHNSYIYRRAVKRARTQEFTPISVFVRELEVPS